MKEECLICKAPLEYLKEDIEMECALCHKKEKSKTKCNNGHYVCNEMPHTRNGQPYRDVPVVDIRESGCDPQ